jgi:hypothetical protein
MVPQVWFFNRLSILKEIRRPLKVNTEVPLTLPFSFLLQAQGVFSLKVPYLPKEWFFQKGTQYFLSSP